MRWPVVFPHRAVGHNGPAGKRDVQMITRGTAQHVDRGPIGHRTTLIDLAHPVDIDPARRRVRRSTTSSWALREARR